MTLFSLSYLKRAFTFCIITLQKNANATATLGLVYFCLLLLTISLNTNAAPRASKNHPFSGNINSALEADIPPTENFLLHFVALREKNLKNLVAYIKSECGNKITTKNSEGKTIITYLRKLNLCYFPGKLQKYLYLQARIFLNKEELIYFPDLEAETMENDPTTVNTPWNLSKILSQTYILRSNPNGVDSTIDQIVELLVQKKELLRELELADKEIKKMTSQKTLLRYYLIPSLKATINNITPLGAMLELFHEIKCSLQDSFCQYLKGRIGSVLNEIAKKNQHQLLSFTERFNKYTTVEGTQKSLRLKELLAFNIRYHQAEITDKIEFPADIKKVIMDFVADGEGGFLNDRFQVFAQHILLLSEVHYFTQNLLNLAPYESDLSPAKKAKAIKALNPQIIKSINILETQFKLLGFDEELGG